MPANSASTSSKSYAPSHEEQAKQARDAIQRLMEAPFDVILEVFAHVHPLDLLRLSRTTKSFRSVLMHKSSRSVWRASIAAVDGLPECPPDLTEPQYVNLVFDDHCHFCLVDDVLDVYWNCRVRCCQNCIYEQFITLSELQEKIPSIVMKDTKLDTIFPSIVYRNPRRDRTSTVLYYLPVVDQYLRELAEIETDREKLTRWSQEKREAQGRRLADVAQYESFEGSRTRQEINLLYGVFFVWLLAILLMETDLAETMRRWVYTMSDPVLQIIVDFI